MITGWSFYIFTEGFRSVNSCAVYWLHLLIGSLEARVVVELRPDHMPRWRVEASLNPRPDAQSWAPPTSPLWSLDNVSLSQDEEGHFALSSKKVCLERSFCNSWGFPKWVWPWARPHFLESLLCLPIRDLVVWRFYVCPHLLNNSGCSQLQVDTWFKPNSTQLILWPLEIRQTGPRHSGILSSKCHRNPGLLTWLPCPLWGQLHVRLEGHLRTKCAG